ncbi:hypothetical protein [Cellulosimicrobium sp. Marseille-Q4280]|uniref:hypothetical protein n=1 Tax=Cellulosimicrobium sp. Marseille-Q4280 TaxID=2937992 RepID=UPI00203E8AC7|nr:hypothetical protein [Cellulosimicrobium sp. Marseille-Q4280]
MKGRTTAFLHSRRHPDVPVALVAEAVHVDVAAAEAAWRAGDTRDDQLHLVQVDPEQVPVRGMRSDAVLVAGSYFGPLGATTGMLPATTGAERWPVALIDQVRAALAVHPALVVPDPQPSLASVLASTERAPGVLYLLSERATGYRGAVRERILEPLSVHSSIDTALAMASRYRALVTRTGDRHGELVVHQVLASTWCPGPDVPPDWSEGDLDATGWADLESATALMGHLREGTSPWR